MSKEDLIEVLTATQSVAEVATEAWGKTPNAVFSLQHAVELAQEGVQKAVPGIPRWLELAHQGGNSTPTEVQDSIVEVESALARIELARNEIERLTGVLADCEKATKDLADDLKATLAIAETT